MNDNYGDQREQKQAIRNFEKCLKPGGILFIDHRNYDSMMTGASAPSKSIYYNVSIFSFLFLLTSALTTY
jgi:glycine N-methyltransferase